MQVSYNKLLKKLIDNGLKKTEFAKKSSDFSRYFSKIIKK